MKKRKLLNIFLLISFIITILSAFFSIPVHKLSSTLFLLLTFAHIIVYRKQITPIRWVLLALVVICFLTGIFGMIFDELPVILLLHRVISIVIVCFALVHIYSYYARRKR